jgi:hypothetical protein
MDPYQTQIVNCASSMLSKFDDPPMEEPHSLAPTPSNHIISSQVYRSRLQFKMGRKVGPTKRSALCLSSDVNPFNRIILDDSINSEKSDDPDNSRVVSGQASLERLSLS